MSKANRFVLLMVVLSLMSVSTVFGAYGVGDKVNNFTLPDAYGNMVSFSDFEGMVVVINFWTST